MRERLQRPKQNVDAVQRPEDCLAGGGLMGALMRSTDWQDTVFGPVDEWPQSLRTAVSIMLESRFAMVVAWGSDFRFFYNDGYKPILGTKHPMALGTPGEVIFPEVWSVVGPEFERVRRGESFAIEVWWTVTRVPSIRIRPPQILGDRLSKVSIAVLITGFILLRSHEACQPMAA